MSWRLIVRQAFTFTFYFKPCSETKVTFTFCIVNVNFEQLIDACDQGRMVETCCAKENIEYWERVFSCLSKKRSGKRKTEQWKIHKLKWKEINQINIITNTGWKQSTGFWRTNTQIQRNISVRSPKEKYINSNEKK